MADCSFWCGAFSTLTACRFPVWSFPCASVQPGDSWATSLTAAWLAESWKNAKCRWRRTNKLLNWSSTSYSVEQHYDMFEHLLQLRWPVTADLSDKIFTKQTDAKTLDMRDEYWSLVSDQLPLLQPMQVMTLLYSTSDQPSASALYLMLWSFVKV